MKRRSAWVIVALLLSLVTTPTISRGQVAPPRVFGDPCQEPNDSSTTACQLGQPNAMGITMQGLFSSPTDVDAYRFDVPAPGAQAYISLSDLWHEARLRLIDARSGAPIIDSDRQGQTQGQLFAPELINRWLEPGSYLALAMSSAESYAGAEAHSYTLRVALGPRPANPAGPAPAPDSARGYSLTLSIEPNDPGPFSLMTFTATINPPFTDLFDFAWTVDGQPFGDNSAVVQLPRPTSGNHTVVVVARGARPYPDYTLPETPPTLGASGSFSVR